MPQHPNNPARRSFLQQTTLLAAATSLATLSNSSWANTLASPIARTRSGRLAGQTENGTHVFRGIPYGADTAPRRFALECPHRLS